jgi:predicted lysophospholipase L1 biosynthesis ABC-type transport system permease subunit
MVMEGGDANARGLRVGDQLDFTAQGQTIRVEVRAIYRQ